MAINRTWLACSGSLRAVSTTKSTGTTSIASNDLPALAAASAGRRCVPKCGKVVPENTDRHRKAFSGSRYLGEMAANGTYSRNALIRRHFDERGASALPGHASCKKVGSDGRRNDRPG